MIKQKLRYGWPVEKPKIQYLEADVKHCQAKFVDNIIIIRFPEAMARAERKKTAPLLAQKLANKINNNQLRIIVNTINRRCFDNKAPVKFARFSHRLTRSLGNYSSKGVLKIATRMMFQPKEVFDYIVIHELAHGIEFNHSKRFWKVVEDACPEYKGIKEWINNNV